MKRNIWYVALPKYWRRYKYFNISEDEGYKEKLEVKGTCMRKLKIWRLRRGYCWPKEKKDPVVSWGKENSANGNWLGKLFLLKDFNHFIGNLNTMGKWGGGDWKLWSLKRGNPQHGNGTPLSIEFAIFLTASLYKLEHAPTFPRPRISPTIFWQDYVQVTFIFSLSYAQYIINNFTFKLLKINFKTRSIYSLEF